MGIQLRGRFRDDFPARRLDLDCARMTVNAELFEVLRVIRAEAMVVVATDNMDCFARAFEHARHTRRRLKRDRETLADWAVICDDIICSSQAGALKSEDPQVFFGPWLAAHGVGFTDAVLIDDRADNCAAFTSQGGTAIQCKMGANRASGAVGILVLGPLLRPGRTQDSNSSAEPWGGKLPANFDRPRSEDYHICHDDDPYDCLPDTGRQAAAVSSRAPPSPQRSGTDQGRDRPAPSG